LVVCQAFFLLLFGLPATPSSTLIYKHVPRQTVCLRQTVDNKGLRYFEKHGSTGGAGKIYLNASVILTDASKYCSLEETVANLPHLSDAYMWQTGHTET